MSDRTQAESTGKAPPRSEVAKSSSQVILDVAGALQEVTEQCCTALRQAGTPIFHRGDNTLYRVMRVENSDDRVSRPVGAVTLKLLDVDWLRGELARCATFVHYDGKTGKEVLIDPKVDRVRNLIASGGEMEFPFLKAIVHVPILTRDGRLITKPGYDPETCLFLALNGEWPLPASEPDRAAAIGAREILENFMRHFPFASDADRAVALSATLTSITRGMYPTAPMHCFDAPTAGTGKSLKVDADSILSTGRPASVIDWGKDLVEAGKRLDAAQMEGHSLIAIDNVDSPLEGSTLCQMLTQGSRNIRVLGQSKVVAVPCVATVIATGNNLNLRGDIVRRALVCRMDPQTDRPELRSIDQDLLKEAAERQKELVMAALTIIQAYILAGRPDLSLSPYGSFDEWSRTVRSALVWSGAADPCDTITRSRDLDPTRQQTEAVLSEWWRVFGDQSRTASQAIKLANSDQEFREVLAQICDRRGALCSRALGGWLRAHRDCRVHDMVLSDGGMDHGAVRWRVVNCTDANQSGYSGTKQQGQPRESGESGELFASIPDVF